VADPYHLGLTIYIKVYAIGGPPMGFLREHGRRRADQMARGSG
jgi:hypothetical protein